MVSSSTQLSLMIFANGKELKYIIQLLVPHNRMVEAINLESYLVNRSPHRALDGKVPEVIWSSDYPNYSNIRIVDCSAYLARDRKRREIKPPQKYCEGDLVAYTLSVAKSIDLVDLSNYSEADRAFGCKNQDDTRYNARLVTKGYSQVEGVDFRDVFSSVVKHTSIRALLALLASYNLELEQLDIKTAFLHGDSDEEIYIQQLEGFKTDGKEDNILI
ncbi:Retrovirus-related Pol polyprotein from transposon TNT 1-94 [Gossypium australe]|uniref:Retrovirus-related Pol polyprotein from transposon TNT 1-94 n=1 Tax=Gossypium australe TaxID=47621 RepID=A0A5B6UHN1_9ROSI|nr:Retrovirus-related Pol polyprotein from transposon TNT 1-94 [Gossypium australe]